MPDATSAGHVLLTGGAGFIGSHLAEALLAAGIAVTAVDNFDPLYSRHAKRQNVARALSHPCYELVEADVRDARALAAIPGAYDAVVHLAALAGVRRSVERALEYTSVNVTGTQVMLEWARARGVGQFLFASSSSVYGVNPRVPWAEDDPQLDPVSPYAATKVSGEMLGRVYSRLFGVRFVALRLFTVYGPRQRPDLAIHEFARRILRDEPIPLYGDPRLSRRDYTYVTDVVRGIVAALEYQRSPYEVINLASGRPVCLDDLVAALERALGTSARVQRLPSRPGDVPQTWANVSKAQRLLGYRAETGLDEGLARYAEWLTAHSHVSGGTDPDFV